MTVMNNFHLITSERAGWSAAYMTWHTCGSGVRRTCDGIDQEEGLRAQARSQVYMAGNA